MKKTINTFALVTLLISTGSILSASTNSTTTSALTVKKKAAKELSKTSNPWSFSIENTLEGGNYYNSEVEGSITNYYLFIHFRFVVYICQAKFDASTPNSFNSLLNVSK